MRTVTTLLTTGLLSAAALVMSTPAAAQTRPAMVRSVDEPARVPYFHSLAPTCTFTNQCFATFPTIPAGKRLRVTAIMGYFRGTNTAGFVLLQNVDFNNPLVAFPVSPFNAAYYGSVISFNTPADIYFGAGQTPVLEFGIPAFAGGISVSPENRLTISGYLVDVLP